MQSGRTPLGVSCKLQNGLLASSVSAWRGVAGDGSGPDWRRASRVCAWFAGARVLWPVRSGFMERWPICICPENAGSCSVAHPGPPRPHLGAMRRKRVPRRHHPVLHLYGLESSEFISQVVQWLHAISWRLHITGKERQGNKRNGVQTAREAGSNQWACLVGACAVLNPYQWHGAGSRPSPQSPAAIPDPRP
jgi:hypothetical protein